MSDEKIAMREMAGLEPVNEDACICPYNVLLASIAVSLKRLADIAVQIEMNTRPTGG